MNKITTMAAAVLAAVFISSCGNRANAPENETDLSVAHKYTNPTPGEFPILGWFSIRGNENQTRERYLEMAECGFNLSLPYVDSLSEVRLALDASRGTGVRIIAKCAELDSLPEQTVGELMSHPSLAGYFFKDEPHMELYGQLADRVRRVRAVDDSKMLYLNLFPTYAGPVLLGTDSYNEYISRFIEYVGTGMVSYDHYSITADTLGHTALNPDYYKNLEIVSEESRRAGVPFWAFALSTAHYSFPAATREHLRLQMFSNLAYGAQGVEYFTYWQFPGLGESQDVPITNAGQRGTSWYIVRDLNREIRALTPVFLGAEVVGVWHSGDSIPEGTRRLESLPQGIKSLKAEGGSGVLVSHLRNGHDEYMMVVNRDLHHQQRLTVEAEDGAEYVVADGNMVDYDKMSPQHLMAPGDYVLLKLPDPATTRN